MGFVRLCFLLLALGFYNLSNAQTIDLVGRVVDEIDQSPLVGAVVALESGEIDIQAVTDIDGKFRFPELVAGYYQVEVSFVGYQTKVLATVDIRHGREQLGTIELQTAINSFDQVVVKAQTDRRGLPVTEIHTITVEEVLRFPATFYDPARMASNYAGVYSENDQANSLVVRGNSPVFTKWFLNDVEMVNPNHLANAGAFGDRSAASGGGVNILSAQLLDYTQLHKGSFDASMGNVIGGALDMRFRPGNNEKVSFKGQIGLIGIDAAVEGPLVKGKEHSFLVNYRYSTLGILSSMGVDLGDEEINFQDLAFNLNFVLPKGQLSVFGMGGSSSNRFQSPEDRTMWETFKDQQDIDFDAEMGAVGVTYRAGQLSASLLYSGLDHQRETVLYDDQGGSSSPFEFDQMQESRLGLHVGYKIPLKNSSSLRVGTRLTLASYNLMTAREMGENFAFDADDGGLLAQVYGDYQVRLSDNLQLSAGLHVTHYTLSSSGSLEPRLRLRYQTDERTSLALTYGLHSQTPDPSVLLYTARGGNGNSELELIKSHHLGLTWERFLNTSEKIAFEIYYQNLYDVPVLANAGSTFSLLNHLPYIPFGKFDNRGTGSNAGVEIGYHKYFDGGIFWEINGTYYNSQYVASDGVRRSTRWDGQYAVNVTGGKEFSLGENDKLLGINARAVVRGGFWDSPIEPMLSQNALRTIYNEPDAFSIRTDTYYKVDLRFYYKRNRKKYSSMVGLDLLNVTNAQAIAYYIWDPLTQQRDVVDQLGLIPNLSYRIEF